MLNPATQGAKDRKHVGHRNTKHSWHQQNRFWLHSSVLMWSVLDIWTSRKWVLQKPCSAIAPLGKTWFCKSWLAIYNILILFVRSLKIRFHTNFIATDQSPKFHNAPVPYPTMHESEQKCVHSCSELYNVRYGTDALWYLWDWPIRMVHFNKLLLEFLSATLPSLQLKTKWVNGEPHQSSVPNTCKHRYDYCSPVDLWYWCCVYFAWPWFSTLYFVTIIQWLWPW